MSVVSIRIVGEEKAVKQAREELMQKLGGRIDIVPMQNRSENTWVALGTMMINDDPKTSEQRSALSPASMAMSGDPLFEVQARVRVLSTGRTGTIIDIIPSTSLMQQRGEWWRYVVQFDDGMQYSYVAYALEAT
jgi:hypothetical protein